MTKEGMQDSASIHVIIAVLSGAAKFDISGRCYC